MKSLFIQLGATFAFLLVMVAPPAHADVAVLIRITDTVVTLQRVERSVSNPEESSDAIIKRLQAPLEDRTQGTLANRLVIEWFDASGTLVHRESQQDPRFIHAPDGKDVVLPEALILIRAPGDAVEIRVRPRGFGHFTKFNV